MIELKHNTLKFSFPDVHKKARCEINFQRTLRIPDDNNSHSLPPGLGNFPLHHVDDYDSNLPATWKQHGGIFLPMYQAEAMWICFKGDYPCAIKIAAGKINAVSGDMWTNELDPNEQDYVVTPDQPWLDGFNVSEGHVRQFVAMPLGQSYTAEEQLTGAAEYGGLQIVVYPMKTAVYKKLFGSSWQQAGDFPTECSFSLCREYVREEMGLAPGGLMKQEIYDDGYGIDAWDQEHGLRCFVHITNSEAYEAITGQQPPHECPSAEQYTSAGLPWFDYYSEKPPVKGAHTLAGLTSVAAKTIEVTGQPLCNNTLSGTPDVVKLHSGSVVRTGEF
ncbi:hypothetical protein Q4485_14905 [Granulosicoccaceae sp. 1_MG-2023]|nr:hypothetical protein [Granulosicoccaceae sp. 1_MG-2023]